MVAEKETEILCPISGCFEGETNIQSMASASVAAQQLIELLCYRRFCNKRPLAVSRVPDRRPRWPEPVR